MDNSNKPNGGVKNTIDMPFKQITRRVLITIHEDTATILRLYGNGNLSLGIRKAARLVDPDPI